MTALLATAGLDVEAIHRSGAVVRRCGTVVRVLRVTPLHPALLGDGDVTCLTEGIGGLVDALPAGGALELYVEAGPVFERKTDAAQNRSQAGDDALAKGRERIVATQREAFAAEGVVDFPRRELTVHVVVPTHGPPRGRGRAALHASLLETETVRRALVALGLRPRMLDGPEVARLLVARFDPAVGPREERPLELLGDLDEREEAAAAARAAADLKVGLAPFAPAFDKRSVTVGRDVEQVLYVGSAPGDRHARWLLEALRADHRFTLAVHLHAPASERPPRRLRRREPEPMADAAGSTTVSVSVYLAVRVRGPNVSLGALAEAVDDTSAALAAGLGCSVQRGEFRQRDLWQATLPLGHDGMRATRPWPRERLAAGLPLAAAWCSSPSGMSLGVEVGSGLIARLDPFDPAHASSAMLVSGPDADAAAAALLGRLLAAGVHATVVDLGGHHADMAMLRPGGRQVRLGRDGSVDPWDTVSDRVSPEKLAYLVELHELALHALAADEREALRAAAIAAYGCARAEGRAAQERDLHAELTRRADAADGPDRECLSAIAAGVGALAEDDPAVRWLSHPARLPTDAPVLAITLADVPDALRPAAGLAAAEQVLVRARRRRADAASPREVVMIAGTEQLFGRPAGAAWLARAARRARADGAFLLAVAERAPQRSLASAFPLRLVLADAPEPARWVNGTRGAGPIRLPITAAERAVVEAA